MLIYFPQMHEELAVDKIEGALFLDPGLGGEEESNSSVFRPTGFPLTTELCRRMADDFMQFGEHFKRSGEMASYIGQIVARANVESDRSIEAELMDRIDNIEPDVDHKPALIQAQLLIALAYAYEEKIIELNHIEKSLNDAWTGFGDKLGLGDEGHPEEKILGEVFSNAPVSKGSSFLLPWKKTLEGFAAYLPNDAMLVTSNQDAISTWEDLEIASKPSAVSGAEKEFCAPVWKFLGYEKGQPEKIWLERELSIAVIAPEK